MMSSFSYLLSDQTYIIAGIIQLLFLSFYRYVMGFHSEWILLFTENMQKYRDSEHNRL